MKQISWNAVRSVTIVCDCTTHQGSSQSMLNEMFDKLTSIIIVSFWNNFKIYKNLILIGISSKFLCKISTCICMRKKYKSGEISPSHFWQNLAKITVL